MRPQTFVDSTGRPTPAQLVSDLYIPTWLNNALDSTNDSISSHEKGWTPVSLSASGQILAAPGTIKGFYVASTTSGTLGIADKTSSGGTAIPGTITPAVGWHEFPAEVANGAYVTIGGTISVVFFVRAGTQA